VPQKKATSWKVLLLVLCFVGPLLAWLGFGDQGLIQLYRKEIERQAFVEKIRRLAEENQKMLEEIHRLRTDLSYVEAVARNELNLVKPNELIYRFNDEKKQHDADKTSERNLTPTIQMEDSKRR
jgi:cell division protein FtsB